LQIKAHGSVSARFGNRRFLNDFGRSEASSDDRIEIAAAYRELISV
jgi:hypothetical protein